MRFYTKTHQYYCGIDRHARSMYLCIISQEGEVVLHHNIKAEPRPFMMAIHGGKAKNDRFDPTVL